MIVPAYTRLPPSSSVAVAVTPPPSSFLIHVKIDYPLLALTYFLPLPRYSCTDRMREREVSGVI